MDILKKIEENPIASLMIAGGVLVAFAGKKILEKINFLPTKEEKYQAEYEKKQDSLNSLYGSPFSGSYIENVMIKNKNPNVRTWQTRKKIASDLANSLYINEDYYIPFIRSTSDEFVISSFKKITSKAELSQLVKDIASIYKKDLYTQLVWYRDRNAFHKGLTDAQSDGKKTYNSVMNYIKSLPNS